MTKDIYDRQRVVAKKKFHRPNNTGTAWEHLTKKEKALLSRFKRKRRK